MIPGEPGWMWTEDPTEPEEPEPSSWRRSPKIYPFWIFLFTLLSN